MGEEQKRSIVLLLTGDWISMLGVALVTTRSSRAQLRFGTSGPPLRSNGQTAPFRNLPN